MGKISGIPNCSKDSISSKWRCLLVWLPRLILLTGSGRTSCPALTRRRTSRRRTSWTAECPAAASSPAPASSTAVRPRRARRWRRSVYRPFINKLTDSSLPCPPAALYPRGLVSWLQFQHWGLLQTRDLWCLSSRWKYPCCAASTLVLQFQASSSWAGGRPPTRPSSSCRPSDSTVPSPTSQLTIPRLTTLKWTICSWEDIWTKTLPAPLLLAFWGNTDDLTLSQIRVIDPLWLWL